MMRKDGQHKQGLDQLPSRLGWSRYWKDGLIADQTNLRTDVQASPSQIFNPSPSHSPNMTGSDVSLLPLPIPPPADLQTSDLLT